MKKIIIAALALATSGFCTYTGFFSPTQVGILEGCTDGTTAIAILLPNTYFQYVIKSNQAIFNNSFALAQQAVATGKNLNIEYNGTTSYSYKYNGGCQTTQSFLNVYSVTFGR